MSNHPFGFDVALYDVALFNESSRSYISMPPASLTGGVSKVIRWSHYTSLDGPDLEGAAPLQNTEHALSVITQHKKHLKALEMAGILVPNVAMMVGEHPAQPDKVAIYSIADHIKAQPLIDAPPEMYQRLGNALLGYCQWIEASNEKYFLADIATPDQYGLTEDGEIVLFDVDPLYGARDGSSEDQFRYSLINGDASLYVCNVTE